MRTRLRAMRDQERGMTLVELLVAMMILGIAMAIFGTTLASVQRGVMEQDRFSQANDQARLALQQLDREMRSGNVLYDPASESDPHYMVRIYTQTNADTRATGDDSGYRCVQWRVSSQKLQTRWWPPDRPNEVSTWRTVAEGIVNKTFSVHAFALDSDPLKGNRVLNVTLRVSVDPGATSAQATEIQAAFTGRNTAYGFPVSVCSPAPA